MSGIMWWIRQLVLILLGSFFLYYGVKFAFGVSQLAAKGDVIRKSANMGVKAVLIHVVSQFSDLTLSPTVFKIVYDQNNTYWPIFHCHLPLPSRSDKQFHVVTWAGPLASRKQIA